MRTSLAIGIGASIVLAGTAIAVAVAGRDEPAGESTATPPLPRAGAGPIDIGVRWSPDARLPQSLAGGVLQAEWAAALVQHLDTDGSGSLEARDGAQGMGAWGSTSSVVDRIIARYDTSGDAVVDSGEALDIGAELADSDGLLTQSAVDELRAALGER